MISVLATISLSGFGAFLLVLLGISFIIFVHEMGHFLAARAVGIKVETFAIGFGTPLLTFRKGIGLRVGSSLAEMNKRAEQRLRSKQGPADENAQFTPQQIADAAEEIGIGETEYRLAVLPLGGYVKMLGQEDLDPAARSADPRSYNNKPVWARMIVISAGVVMNLIFSIIFFMAAFMHGIASPPAIVGSVSPGSSAAITESASHPGIIGLQPGDEIIKIDGDRPSGFMELVMRVALARSDSALVLDVKRPIRAGQFEAIRFELKPIDSAEGLKQVGIGPIDDTVIKVEDGSSNPYELDNGMRLIAIEGKPITAYHEYYRAVQASGGWPLSMTFRDDGDNTTKVVSVRPLPVLQSSADGSMHLLGIVPTMRITSVDDKGAAKDILEPGDEVIAVNSILTPSVTQFIAEIKASDGKPVKIRALRDGERMELSVTPERKNDVYRIGVAVVGRVDSTTVAEVLPSSPFAQANWVPGTVIHAINDQPVADFTDIYHAIVTDDDGRLTVSATVPVASNANPETQTVAVSSDQIEALRQMSWTTDLPPFEPLEKLQKAHNPFAAVSMGFDSTWLQVQQTYLTLARLFQRELSPDQLMGPVGIADVGTKVAQRGWPRLVFFMGIISTILAVVNFLPFPILDGGHFVLLIIEKMRGGKPVPDSIQNAMAMVALVLLLSLVLYVTFNDVMRMIGT